MRDLVISLLVALAASALSCRSPAPSSSPPSRAFYFWRTRLDLAPAESEALERLHVDRLFVRFFDVEWSPAESAARSVAVLEPRAPKPLPPGLELVPVVFLRAEVFARTWPARLPDLAARTWKQVRQVAEAGGLAFREVQIDCDWTEATRDAYFTFLQHLKKQARGADVSLSATIRLHQVKYRERTGVPPVDRGMLMFYNMGRLSADPDTISIFDAASAKRYTQRIHEYPLPLDTALPIWSWTVHLRGDEVVGLMQATDPDELTGIPWLSPAGAGRFSATKTAFLHGTLVRQGDLLKPERIGAAEARAAAQLVATALPQPRPSGPKPRTIALFDLSERNLARHGQTSLDQLFQLFLRAQ